MLMNVLALAISVIALAVSVYFGRRQMRAGDRANDLGEESLRDSRRIGAQLEAWLAPVDGKIWSFNVRNVGVRPVRLFVAEFQRGGTCHKEQLGQCVIGPNSTLPIPIVGLGAEVAQGADVTLWYSLTEGDDEMSPWYVSHLETRND